MFIPFVMIFTGLLMVPPTHTLDVVVLRAARGYDARLPCGQGKVFLDGPRSYVVWLKDDKDFLYRFPEDESVPRSLDPNIIYGTTCKAGVCYDETSLLLKNVSDKDGGLYTCRVHYQASPSDEFMIEIRLVEPTGKPHIRTETGEAPENMNPISLGANLTLICFLVDGPKDAILYWERNGEPVQSYMPPGENSAVIQITNVTWAENMAKYECLAQNTDVSLPFTTNFNLKMNLQPMEAHLSSYDPYWEANVSAQIQCSVFLEAIESPTIITWYINGAEFKSYEYEMKAKGQHVTSILTFYPALEDDDNELLCIARRPMLNLVSETRTIIHVGKRPTCASIESEKYVEIGDSVKCVVFSVIRPLQFVWSFDDLKTMYENMDATSNLVIKQDGIGRFYTTLIWKSKMRKGHLTCLAKNKYGLQKQPCYYSILPVYPPSTPHCNIKRDSTNIDIDCTKGWTDVYSNSIYMELKNGEGKHVHNMSNTLGRFRVDGINARSSYTVIIYASNLRGRSAQIIQKLPAKAIVTTTSTTKTENMGTDLTQVRVELIAGVISIIVIAGILFIITFGCPRKRSAYNPSMLARSAEDGQFQREPDVVGDALASTNNTVNQMPGTDNVQTPESPDNNGVGNSGMEPKNLKVQIQGTHGYLNTSLVQLGNRSMHTQVNTAQTRIQNTCQVNTAQTRIQNTCQVSRAGAHYYV